MSAYPHSDLYWDKVDIDAEATGYPWEARVSVCRSATAYGPGFVQSYVIDRPYERYGEFWLERVALAMLIAWRRNGGRWIGNAIGGVPFPTNTAITAMLDYLPNSFISGGVLSEISFTITV